VSAAESAIDPRRIVAGHGVVKTAGTTAEMKRRAEKSSHPAAMSSTRTRGAVRSEP
jgi:hypothetical protein